MRILAALSPLCLVACSVHPALPDAIEGITDIAVEYDGAIEPQSWITTIPDADSEANDDEPDALVEYEFALYKIDRDAARHVFGVGGGPNAAIVKHADANVRLERLESVGRATRVNSSQLSIVPGRSGSVAVVNQRAYIERFEIGASRDTMIADPMIGVAKEGIRITLTPSNDAQSIDAEVLVTRLQKPIPVCEIGRNATHLSSVSLQIPVFVNDRVKLSTQLPEGSAALVSGITLSGTHEILLSLLSRTNASPGTAGSR